MIDTVLALRENQEFSSGPGDGTWKTIYPTFPVRKDSFNSLKIWGEIKRVGGAGNAELRIQLTDGVDTYNSPSLQSSDTDWDPVGPATLDISSIADKEWDCNIQGKAASGAEMKGRKFTVQRHS